MLLLFLVELLANITSIQLKCMYRSISWSKTRKDIFSEAWALVGAFECLYEIIKYLYLLNMNKIFILGIGVFH